MSVDAGSRQALARQLAEAWDGAVAVAAPSLQFPSLSVDDAYLIQDQIIEWRLGRGRNRAGWKLGLTSAGPGVTPIVGTLLDDMVRPTDTRVDPSTLVGPMVEAELVVKIGESVHGEATAADLKRGRHLVGPGLEVIDYRTVDSTGPVDWVADNSTVAYAVVGELVPVADVDLASVEVTLARDGEPLASGTGAVVMGDPLEAVAWLAAHLAARGRALEPGDVVLTGSLTGHHTVPVGVPSEFVGDFGDFGAVVVRFAGS